MNIKSIFKKENIMPVAVLCAICLVVAAVSFFGDDAATVIFTLMGVGLAIAALVLGINSIKVFSGFKNARPKPVATLVLGIVGVTSSGFALMFSLIFLAVA